MWAEIAQREVHPALQEEERCDHSEGDDPELALELAMAVEHRRQREPEDEGRQHRVALAPLREQHEAQEQSEEQLDLRLDHSRAVALEDRRQEPRGREHHERRDGEESRRRPARSREQ